MIYPVESLIFGLASHDPDGFTRGAQVMVLAERPGCSSGRWNSPVMSTCATKAAAVVGSVPGLAMRCQSRGKSVPGSGTSTSVCQRVGFQKSVTGADQ
jgi:hypothetical protein